MTHSLRATSNAIEKVRDTVQGAVNTGCPVSHVLYITACTLDGKVMAEASTLAVRDAVLHAMNVGCAVSHIAYMAASALTANCFTQNYGEEYKPV